MEQFKQDAPSFASNEPLKKLKKISQLDWNHPVKAYIDKRRIPSAHHYRLYLVRQFKAWVNEYIPDKFDNLDKDEPRLLIPFLDENKNLFGVSARSFKPDSNLRYITIMFDDKPKIFGLDKVDMKKKIYVVEGPIDSLFLDNAIALAGADANIKIQPQQCTMIFDNEPRNKEIVKRMINAVDKKFNVAVWPKTLKYKDINDIIISGKTSSEVQTLISNNTHCGLAALQQINNWKRI